MSSRGVRVLLVFLAVAFALGPRPAPAGTTGVLRGVVLSDGKPVAGATVTATSPSGNSVAVTDAGGHFTFVSLPPDEYTLTVEKPGYDRGSFGGAAVFADATQVVSLTIHKTLVTIAHTTSRSSSSLVRPGTTADVYSINAKQQDRANALGGGGTLDSAYSAIATVPGAYVPTNQSGYLLAVHIRGGDSSEVGYELDGIPMNRIIDGYPSGSLSSLGQLELQVYTGASPADSEGQGLAGFVNQVIKTGTFPGYATADATLGTPTFYHSLNVEAGGSTPDRLFSYYVGIGGYNQDHRYIDQFNGSGFVNEFGQVLDNCPSPNQIAHAGYVAPPSCYTNGALNVGAGGTPGYILGPMPFGNENASIADRSTLFNVHFGLPHKHDGLRDDIQVLYDNDTIFSPLYVSPLDEGLQNFEGTSYPAGTRPYYTDWYQYLGAAGTFLPAPAEAARLVVPYYFPSSPANRAFDAPLPLTTRDVQYNQQAVFKLQYQKNISSDAYLRLYGYTYFATYASAGAVSSWQPYTGYDSGDYELNAHTRGLAMNFGKQFGPEHLVTIEGSYTNATSMDYNNFEMFGSADNFAVLVNPHDLGTGVCYAAPRNGTVASPTTCNPGSLQVDAPATFASLGGIAGGQTYDPTKWTCGGVTCAYYVGETGPYGQVERVTPTFYGISATDEYRPSDALVFNAGVRLDNYQFVGENTTGGPARAFWMTAFNDDTCYNTSNLTLYDKTALLGGGSIPVTSPCSAAGPSYQNVHMENSPTDYVYNLWQPRIGATYTVDADTVLRASWGKYNEQPSSSYEQYNALQQNLPTELIPYYSQGFNTPGHEVSPAISFNSDFSLEHHFKGTQLSLKLTPFLRQTHDEIENFYIDIKEGIIAGLNAGSETSSGFELALNDGDFDRDGFAGQFSFAYTNVYVKYSVLPNGTTILSPINADIANYNAYTSACAPGGGAVGHREFGTPLCGVTTTGAPSAACYVPVYGGGGAVVAGTPAPCGSKGAYANPYWNAPVQSLLDPNGAYLPYSVIPGAIGTGVNAYNYPYVATAVLNFKHHKFAATPSFQFVAGNRYGAPETMPGIDPAAGCTALPGSIAGDPRYPYGAPGGSPYDAHTCLGQLNAIPDSFTGVFDGLGAFREPSQIMAHLRLSYDATPNVSFVLTLANLVSTCYGGQRTRFTYFWSSTVCQYGGLAEALPPVGNDYNPRDNVQTFQRYPYEPDFGTYNDLNDSTVAPFSAYFALRLKI